MKNNCQPLAHVHQQECCYCDTTQFLSHYYSVPVLLSKLILDEIYNEWLVLQTGFMKNQRNKNAGTSGALLFFAEALIKYQKFI